MRLRLVFSLVVIVAVIGTAALMGGASGPGTQAGSPTAPRIINGEGVSEKTFEKRWPFMAGMITSRVESTYDGQFCGGAVIAPRLVITAAHCMALGNGVGLQVPDKLDVLVNRRVLSDENEGRRIRAEAVFVHPSYDDNAVRNDVAVVRLSKPTTVTPISISTDPQLWGAGAGRAESADGAWIGGWGNTKPKGYPKYADAMRETAVSVVSDQKCAEAYGAGFEPAVMLCAADFADQQDTCQGDSGGPMTMRNAAGAYELIGLTSWGKGCAKPGYPGVYTRIGTPALREWVKSIGTTGGPGGIMDPMNVTAKTSGTSVTLAWRAPNSGPAPGSYQVYVEKGAYMFQAISRIEASSRSTNLTATVRGLATSKTYTFYVRSVGKLGVSPGASRVTVTTAAS